MNFHPSSKFFSDMTVLDIVSTYRGTEAVFKKYDAVAGECICCNALFEPLKTVAARYGLDLGQLIRELEDEIAGTD